MPLDTEPPGSTTWRYTLSKSGIFASPTAWSFIFIKATLAAVLLDFFPLGFFGFIFNFLEAVIGKLKKIISLKLNQNVLIYAHSCRCYYQVNKSGSAIMLINFLGVLMRNKIWICIPATRNVGIKWI